MPAEATLLDRLRRDLAEEARPPSRARLEGWIRAGAARVDGRVVRDPAAPVAAAARVTFALDELEPAALLPPRRRTAAAAAALPPGVLHADAQVVVVRREAFGTFGEGGFAAAVAARLGPGVRALVVVADPSAPGSGPVLLATSAAVARRLAGDVREGRVLETLLSLRTPPRCGPREAIEQPGEPAALVRREEAPLAPPPAGCRELVPPARVLLTFKHPRTNRRLTFTADPPA